ncbi:MAG: hypothetical protein FJ284_02840 [Planctomycetes bacterium]|nr:hypothetical protein [Planctomycetota bacterium]
MEDNLRTTQERLANVDEARRKLDVVAAEGARLEAKIAVLAAGAVARRDVSEIAQRVDEVAEGMKRTDETMRQLQLSSDLEELDDPPALLREEGDPGSSAVALEAAARPADEVAPEADEQGH